MCDIKLETVSNEGLSDHLYDDVIGNNQPVLFLWLRFTIHGYTLMPNLIKNLLILLTPATRNL